MSDRVLLLSLGGTIAMTSDSGSAVTPKLSGADLVEAVPELAQSADVTAESFRTIPGAHLSYEDLAGLAERISESAGEGFDGVVVTQGTDTLEETAFTLDLLLRDERPVVFTGAMRNPTQAGADGPANVLAAVRVAAAPSARGTGVTVVLGDEVHAARLVRKSHTQSPAAFESVPGPIGWVSEGVPRFPLALPALPDLELSGRGAQRVALLTASLDDAGDAVTWAAGAGYDGIVVEALGAGHLPLPWAEAVGAVARELPVAFTTRTGTGQLLTSTYGFPGSESDLIERGAFPAGFLDGPKARVLMTLLLKAGADREAVERGFAAYLDATTSVGRPEAGG